MMERDRQQFGSSWTWLLAALLVVFCFVSVRAQIAKEELAQDPQQQFNYAYGLYRRGFHDMALVELERYLRAYPDDAGAMDAQLFRIDCLQKLGRTPEMLAAVREFLKVHPEHKEAQRLRMTAADALVQEKNFEEATPLLLELSQSANPKDQEYAMYYLAHCYQQSGRANDAFPLLQQLASKPFEAAFPYRAYAAQATAAEWMKVGKNQEALALYKRLATFADTPAELAEGALFHVGFLEMSAGHAKAALAAFEKTIARNADGKYARLARKYRFILTMEAGKIRECLALADDWRQRYPDTDDHEMDYYQAYALQELKRYEEALPFFQRVEENPKAPARIRQDAAYYSLFCLMMAGHMTVAEQKTEEFLAKYPRATVRGYVLRLRGEVLLNLKRHADAEKVLHQAIEFFAETPEERTVSSELLLRVLTEQERWREAAEHLRWMAAAPGAKDPATLLLRAGATSLRANDDANARRDFEAAIAKATKPEQTRSARQALADISIRNKDYSHAIEILTALRQDLEGQQRVDIDFYIVQLQYYLERFDDAQKNLQALLNNPTLLAKDRARAQAMLLRLLLQAKKLSEALPVLDGFLNGDHALLDPVVDTELLQNIALLLEENRRPADAEKAWQWLLQRKDASWREAAIARINLAEFMLRTPARAAEVETILEPLLGEWPKDSETEGLSKKDAFSLLAESQLVRGDPEKALVTAGKAQSAAPGSSRAEARTLYLLSFLYLNHEKKPEAANRFATQCYILLDDELYTPAAMVVSARCFLAEGQRARAEAVCKELASKYPVWYSEHPELLKLFTH
ncbi:MAG: hypothetical protein IJJ26_10950 [Victivallales bacterium]|nr:hypothetical protein [Victivallales bacterium]